MSYIPATEFCDNDIVYSRCAGEEFDPITYICENNLLTPRPTNFSVTIVSEVAGAMGDGNYNVGDVVMIIAANDTEEKRFVNCITESAGVNFANANNRATYFIMPQNEVVVTANYEPIVKEYNLTVNANPIAGGIVSPNGTITRNAGSSITVTATEAEGYEFVNWTGAPSSVNSSNKSITFNIDYDMTLIANFRQINIGITPTSYTLTTDIVPAGGGTVSRSPNQTAFDPESQVTIIAMPGTGYEFVNWTGALMSVDEELSFTILSDMNVTANFKRVHTLTTSAIPTTGGSVMREPNKLVYDNGEFVEVVAMPATGYRFVNWTGTGAPSNTTTNPAVITMDGNKTLTANFEVIPTYLVTVSSIGIGASGGGSYAQGATVNINAGTPPANYSFKNWTSTNAGVIFADANNVVTSFIMPNNAVTIMANFEDLSVLIDSRDGQTYRVVLMPDGKRWMAENLNYRSINGNSWCYNNVLDSCAKYGRLYDWASAMDISTSCNTQTISSCGATVNTPHHQGVCPIGWHLPSYAEWATLIDAVGGAPTSGEALRAQTWNIISCSIGNDTYGFSALPGGYTYTDIYYGTPVTYFHFAGTGGVWWTLTPYDATIASAVHTGNLGSWISCDMDNNRYYLKRFGLSVRCVKD